MAAQNRTLGKFKLSGIPPAPRGIPQVEVTFDIDANGILNVSAKDVKTGKEQRIVIKASSGLSEGEIKRMVSDAEAHASEDQTKREEVEARNSLDNMTYNVEKMLKDNGDKVSGSEKSDVEAALTQARTTLQGTSSAADMNAAREKLTAASHKLAEAMYKANASGTPAADAAAGTAGDAGEKKEEGVIDAEYVDVADKK
jgi:molecular chaperone DnaK